MHLDLLLLAVTQHMPCQLGFPAVTGITDLAGEALCTDMYPEMLCIVLPFSKGLGTERACKKFRSFKSVLLHMCFVTSNILAKILGAHTA